MNISMKSVNEKYNDIAILSAYVFLWNPIDLLISVVKQVNYSRNFLNHTITKKKLKNLWAQRALLEGLPNISLSSSKSELDIPSAIHLSSLVKLAAQLTPSTSRNICEIPCIYDFIDTLNLASEVLKECARNSMHDKGVIFIMDMTKSTDFIVRTKDRSYELSHNLSKLKGILIDFGNRIITNNNRSKFWITEGDKFISFIPSSNSDSFSTIWNNLISIYRNLKELRDISGIGFKAGAHFGWLFLAGNFIYSNTDIIIATRTMEFSKRNDVIVVTDVLRQEIFNRLGENNIGKEKIKESFKAPRILLEGKPSKWIRPTEASISVNEKEIQVFEIGE